MRQALMVLSLATIGGIAHGQAFRKLEEDWIRSKLKVLLDRQAPTDDRLSELFGLQALFCQQPTARWSFAVALPALHELQIDPAFSKPAAAFVAQLYVGLSAVRTNAEKRHLLSKMNCGPQLPPKRGARKP